MDKLLNEFFSGLFIMQAVVLLILIVLMAKFAWKPILNALQAREDGIQDALDAAENAKKEMANLKADNEKLAAEARAERDAMLKEAREIKEKMIADAKAEAEVQGSKMIEQAKAAIESEKKAAVAELKNQVAGLSIQIAEKVMKSELSDKEKQAALVDSMLKDVTLN